MTNKAFADATAAEVLNPKNYTMTVTRKETKAGKVSFAHVVTFKGDVFNTRTSGREYQAYVLNIEVGHRVAALRDGSRHHAASAARYRKIAAKGGDQFTPEKYQEWAAEADKTAAYYAKAADDLEAKGQEFNWFLLGTGTGYTANPGRARGVVILASNAAR